MLLFLSIQVVEDDNVKHYLGRPLSIENKVEGSLKLLSTIFTILVYFHT
jgi:hypothetical protein